MSTTTPLDVGELDEVKRLIRDLDEADAATGRAADRPEFNYYEYAGRCEGAMQARRALANYCTPELLSRLVAQVERRAEAETLLTEAAALLDRVEISEGRDTFDGSIAGGAPCDVDLFAPGPKYDEWERAVRANRRARASSVQGAATSDA